VERRIFLQNARSQEISVGSHVVVDGEEFGHRNPLATGEGEQKNKRKQKAEREVGIICSTKAILSEKVDLKPPIVQHAYQGGFQRGSE